MCSRNQRTVSRNEFLSFRWIFTKDRNEWISHSLNTIVTSIGKFTLACSLCWFCCVWKSFGLIIFGVMFLLCPEISFLFLFFFLSKSVWLRIKRSISWTNLSSFVFDTFWQYYYLSSNPIWKLVSHILLWVFLGAIHDKNDFIGTIQIY